MINSAQEKTQPVNFPTPGVASLGLYQSIPVSNFTGIPNISIPLYTLQESDIQVPIALSYHPAQVKPNTFPGWVGLGWDLKAAGVITRQVKGVMDEYNNDWDGLDLGYYYNSFALASSQWYTKEAILNYATIKKRDVCADEFTFSFLSYSGTFYRYNNEWKVVSEDNIIVKFDEATGFNSKEDIQFYMETVEHTVFESNTFFKSFSLITPDGVEYVFGGSDEDGTQAIEYSSNFSDLEYTIPPPTSWYLTKIIPVNGDVVYFNYDIGELNCQINKYFSYKNYSAYYDESLPSFVDMNCTMQSASIGTYAYLNFPVYLSSINSIHSTITFERSEGTKLEYGAWMYPDINQYNDSYYFTARNYWEDELKTYQLDKVTIKNKDLSFIKEFNFSYTEDDGERLKLLKLTETLGNTETKTHTFKYNSESLPYEFGSFWYDHWGFYNGPKSYYGWPDIMFMTAAWYNNKEPDATVDAKYLNAELLEKITYPTGGYSKFEFEPHQYAKIVETDRETISSLSSNKRAGGVRIRKIKFIASPETPEVTKEYFYVKDYSGQEDPSSLTSSGILGGRSKYFWSNQTGTAISHNPNPNSTTYKMDVISSGSVYPYGYNGVGSHIGYSEVIEKETSNGYTKYHYTNFDADYHGNSHKDEIANGWIGPNVFSEYMSYTSKAYERGKLVLKEIFDEGNVPIIKEEYFYEVSTDDYFKMLSINGNSLCFIENGNVEIANGAAYKVYTGIYRINHMTIHDFVDGILTNSTIVNYKYNDYNQIIETSSKNSNNLTYTTVFKRAMDYSWESIMPEVTEMIQRNRIDPVIENVSYVETNGTKKIINGEYKEYNASILEPENYYLLKVPCSGEYTSDFYFKHYTVNTDDVLCNLDLADNEGDEKTETIVLPEGTKSKINIELDMNFVEDDPNGYSFSIRKDGLRFYDNYYYLVHEDYNREEFIELILEPGSYIFSFVYENNDNSLYWGATCRGTLMTVETQSAIYNSDAYLQSQFEYSPEGKVNQVTTKSGGSVSYLWDSSWEYPMAKVVGATLSQIQSLQGQKTSNYSSKQLYDEIAALGLTNVFITTYSYRPLVGITSQTDPNGITTRYNYNNGGQLIHSENEDGYILNQYEYNYAVPITP